MKEEQSQAIIVYGLVYIFSEVQDVVDSDEGLPPGVTARIMGGYSESPVICVFIRKSMMSTFDADDIAGMIIEMSWKKTLEKISKNLKKKCKVDKQDPRWIFGFIK